MNQKRATHNRRAGFTMIELVTVIVILGILSAVALPVYLDYRQDAKIAACKGVLGGVRAAIANYYANNATEGGCVPTFPAMTDLTTVGAVLMDVMGDNPFDTNAVKNNVVAGTTRGAVVGKSGGWAYNTATGQFWANTSTAGIGENGF